MKRRDFLALSAAAALLPSLANAREMTPFTPGVIQALLQEGKTVFVDVATDWCTTCKAQERTIRALRKQNPDYNASMSFVRLDWDIYSRSDFSKKYKIPRRSTLLVLRGNQELGRIVAGTRRKDIQALMDSGLKSA